MGDQREVYRRCRGIVIGRGGYVTKIRKGMMLPSETARPRPAYSAYSAEVRLGGPVPRSMTWWTPQLNDAETLQGFVLLDAVFILNAALFAAVRPAVLVVLDGSTPG